MGQLSFFEVHSFNQYNFINFRVGSLIENLPCFDARRKRISSVRRQGLITAHFRRSLPNFRGLFGELNFILRRNHIQMTDKLSFLFVCTPPTTLHRIYPDFHCIQEIFVLSCSFRFPNLLVCFKLRTNFQLFRTNLYINLRNCTNVDLLTLAAVCHCSCVEF